MTRILRHRASPAMVVACIALMVALTGTSYAAIRLPKNSVGTKQLKKNAVTSAKVQNNTLTGADVNEAKLGQVPSAATATNAAHAAGADSATTAGSANAVYSTYHADPIDLQSFLGTIATLNVPTAGSYVVIAKFGAFNASNTASINNVCVLSAGSDSDSLRFDVDGSPTDDDEVYVGTLVHQFGAPGSIALTCADGGVGQVQAKDTRITAIQVAHLTNTPF